MSESCETIGSSNVSPETEEIVRESIKNGLPIIPFAAPSFDTQRSKPSLTKTSSSTSCMECFENGISLNGQEDGEDDIFMIENDDTQQPCLDSLVRRAQFEIENSDKSSETRKESQSSYVEMCLNGDEDDANDDNEQASLVSHDDNDAQESPYLEMDNSDRVRKCADFNQLKSPINRMKRRPKMSKSMSEISEMIPKPRLRGSIIENEVSRRFKKAIRHKDDYVMFDFEGDDKGYVEMNCRKKWHFLDFGRKSK